MAALGEGLTGPSSLPPTTLARGKAALVFPEDSLRFHPQMLDWVAEQVSQLVFEEGIAASEIAVLAPFLSDALRFALSGKLEQYGIPVRTHRPSRELRAEPAAALSRGGMRGGGPTGDAFPSVREKAGERATVLHGLHGVEQGLHALVFRRLPA